MEGKCLVFEDGYEQQTKCLESFFEENYSLLKVITELLFLCFSVSFMIDICVKSTWSFVMYVSIPQPSPVVTTKKVMFVDRFLPNEVCVGLCRSSHPVVLLQSQSICGIEFLCDPATPLLDVYPKKLKTGTQRKSYAQTFIAALFTVAKRWGKNTCLSSDKWANSPTQTVEYYSAVKNKVLIPAMTWTNLENTMLSKSSQTGRTKPDTTYCMIPFIWNVQIGKFIETK